MFDKSESLHIKVDNGLIKTDVKLEKGINVLVGENGSGKTLFAYAIAACNESIHWQGEELTMFWHKGKQIMINHKERTNLEKQSFIHWTIYDLALDNPDVSSIKYISAFALARFKDFFLDAFVSPRVLWNKFNSDLEEVEKELDLGSSRPSYAEFAKYFDKIYDKNFFLILVKNKHRELTAESAEFFGLNYDEKKFKPEKYFRVWIKFYSDICRKYFLGEDNLLPYLGYCLFYFSLEHFLKNAQDLAFGNEKMGQDFQKEADDYLQHFYKQENHFNSVDKINKINDFFKEMGLDFKCEIKKIKEDDYTEPTFKLVFSSNDSSKKRFPNDFSSGEKTLISILDCLLWFELKRESENIILFIDDFDAFLNPIQAKEVITKLNKLKLKVYFILVSQRPITIVQLNSKFNYLLAENKKISNSTQDDILKKLLKDTPDLNVYKNKQLYIFIESKEKKIDEILYQKVVNIFFSDNRKHTQLIPIGSKDQVQTVFKNSNKDDFPNNLVCIVDNDNDKNLEKQWKNLFTYEPYYSLENFLLSPPVLIQFLEDKKEQKDFWDEKLRKDYTEEIVNKIWNSKNSSANDWQYKKEDVIKCCFVALNENEDSKAPYFLPKFLIVEKVKCSIESYLEWFHEKGCLLEKYNISQLNELDKKKKKEKLNQLRNNLLKEIVNNLTILPIEIHKMFKRIFQNHLPKNDS